MPATGPSASPGAVSYTFNAPVSGTNFAIGDNATQATQHVAANGRQATSAGEPPECDSDTVKAARIGGRYVIAGAIIGAVLTAVLTAVFTNGFGLASPSSRSPGPTPPASSPAFAPSTSAPAATAIERRYDGKDPAGKDGPRSKCADRLHPSQPVSQVHPPVIGPGGTVVGHVELRTSSICPVIWARVYWRNGSYLMPPGWSLHIVMHRRAHPNTAPYVSHVTSNYVYGNMLATVSGCVYAEVYFADGSRHTPAAVTGCFRST